MKNTQPNERAKANPDFFNTLSASWRTKNSGQAFSLGRMLSLSREAICNGMYTTILKDVIMKHFIAIIFLLGISIAQFSCNRPETFDAMQVRKSVEEANAKYSEAIRQGNVAGAVDAYTVDATMVPPDGEIVRGKQAIGEVYRNLFRMGMKEIVMTTIEVGGCSDMAYEIGKTRVRIQPEGQAAIIDSTKYLVIWKRQADATWKVHADIWNVSAPMAGK